MKIVKKSYRFFKDSITSVDRYPRTIAFTFKGQEEFKSFIGGLISVATFTVLIIYSYLMFRTAIEKKDTQQSISLVVQDLTTDPNAINFKGSSFMLGVRLYTDIFDITTDETYMKMEAWQYKQMGNAAEKITIDTKKDTSGEVMNIAFYKDSQLRSYDRQVFSLLDCFGNIGGVNEILESVGALIVGIFASRIFLFSIFTKLYQVETCNNAIEDAKSSLAKEEGESDSNRRIHKNRYADREYEEFKKAKTQNPDNIHKISIESGHDFDHLKQEFNE